MNKSKKLGEALALCGVVLSILQELEENERQELKLLFRALEIEDQDSEKIEDPALYGVALNLDYNADQLKDQAEEMQSFIKGLEKIKL